MKVIDTHVHLITRAMVDDAALRFHTLYPFAREAVDKRAERLFGRDFLGWLDGITVREQAREWLRAMDGNGVERAVFFPISERLEDIRDFVAMAPDRFAGYAFLNAPAAADASERLRRAVNDYGLAGLKLYPSLQLFNCCDERLFPLYAEAQSLGIPITFHFGITHAPVADYRYTNPIDLQLVLNLFPDLNIIIAHFGAGFFREVCLLGYHNKNIHLDTSGTNNWLDYTPERLPLEEIFRRAVEIYSAERIIFGTDTVMRPGAGYRAAIKEEQCGIVRGLGISPEEKELILRGNAERLFFGKR